jgi:hypothetical protein
MVQLANAIAFALLQTVLGRQSFVLSFHNGEGHGLRFRGERATENVIGAASRALAGLMIDNINGPGGFLNANVGAAVPPPILESRINQLKSGLGFVAGHQREGRVVWMECGCGWCPERDTWPTDNFAFVPPMTKGEAMMSLVAAGCSKKIWPAGGSFVLLKRAGFRARFGLRRMRSGLCVY